MTPTHGRRPESTYCPKLWDEIGIDQNGKVYACCCACALSFGDIHKAPLRRIWNSAAARKLRKDSLNGALKCYERCHVLQKAALPPPSPAKPLTSPYENLKILTLRFGELCNIKCVMCVQDHRNTRSLGMADLKPLDLRPFEGIELVGGEPLFIPAAREFFDYAAALGKKVSFISNGTLINDEWARKIARHSRFLYVSLNAATKKTHERVNVGSSWDKVMKSVRSIRKYRQALPDRVHLQGHMTVVPENIHEVPLFIRTFKKLGFDRVCFSHSEDSVKYLFEDARRLLALKEGTAAAYAASKHKADINMRGLAPLLKAALGYHRHK
ncbi:MAG: hypothetical protein A2X35_03190 [Elusimicrobia bacterium GWA2_61_42]|nr:MAG: hypothetical protein A2X35_03190 [Elusimicrobia bacterium GWA2_61_42]OGR77590.1 MAG: hypothetical protein A2X38_09430 [Elusimicrobia bacterium GWC2_61_25]